MKVIDPVIEKACLMMAFGTDKGDQQTKQGFLRKNL